MENSTVLERIIPQVNKQVESDQDSEDQGSEGSPVFIYDGGK